jgi:hypothetical protein
MIYDFLHFSFIVSVFTILALAGRGIYYFWTTNGRSGVRGGIGFVCTENFKMHKHKGNVVKI